MKISQLTTPQIRYRLDSLWGKGAEVIGAVAPLWCELKNRGEDVTAYQSVWTQWLPDVAAGRLSAELVWRHAGFPQLLAGMRRIVPEEQAELAALAEDATVVTVVRPDPRTGELKEELVAPRSLRVAEIRQVFGDGHIRSPEEQRKLVVVPAPKPPQAVGVLANDAAFNLMNYLDAKQIDALTAAASRKGLSPAEFLIDMAVRNKILPAKDGRLRAVA